jgi:RNA polymerase sigma-70 factor (sigma-E family)
MDAAEDFDRFVRARNAGLLRTAWLLVGDWPAAEDLVQIALERLWPKWSRLPDDQQRLAYVHRILTTSFLRGRRRKWIGEVATAELPEPESADGTDALLVRDGVLSAIRRLPPRQRAVVALRYLADLTEPQTAAALHCSVGTVKSYSSRAMSTLRADPGLLDLFAEETKP